MKTEFITLSVAITLGLFSTASQSSAQSSPALWLVNGLGQSAGAQLDTVGTFTTNYLGTNDVTITKTGPANTITDTPWIDNFSNPLNPTYLSTFTGLASNGTGTGTVGEMGLLEVSRVAGTVLTFDFDSVIDSSHNLIFADIDFNESLFVQAYLWNGTSYDAVSTSGWTHTPYAGQMGIAPNSTWATWNSSTGGFLAGTSSNVNEQLNTLTPNNTFDRLVITSNGGNPGGTWEFQMTTAAVPEPSSAILVLVAGLGLMLRRRSTGCRID